ncbi:MAG: hypothetical protein QXU72_03335 [Thermofilum sp.]
MLVRRRGQMLVAAILIVGLIVMSFLLVTYHTHALFLRTRGLVVRETVGAVTADFNRALAAMLALATRSYYNHTRFSDFVSRFEDQGLEPGNLSSAGLVAARFIENWATAARVIFAEQGLQLAWALEPPRVLHLLGRAPEPLQNPVILIDWNKTAAGSYISGWMRLNLTNAGFYNWETRSLIGFTLIIDTFYSSNSTVRLRALVDNGTYYGALLARGWVELYYFDSSAEKWVKAKIKDVTYEGFGYYRITVEERLRRGTRFLIVASDERGILVLAQSTVP